MPRLLTASCSSALLRYSVHLLFFIPQKKILITTKIENFVKNPFFCYSVVAGSFGFRILYGTETGYMKKDLWGMLFTVKFPTVRVN